MYIELTGRLIHAMGGFFSLMMFLPLAVLLLGYILAIAIHRLIRWITRSR